LQPQEQVCRLVCAQGQTAKSNKRYLQIAMDTSSDSRTPLLTKSTPESPPAFSLARGLAVRATVLTVFGGTAFVHGYVIIGLLYFALPFYVWLVGLLIYLLDLMFGGAEKSTRREWSAFLRSFVTTAPLEYFNMKLLMGDDVHLDAAAQYLFCVHPHGIFPYGGVPLYAPASPLLRKFPGLRIHPCGATVCFKVPFIREYLLWTGHMDASRSVMSKQMAKGKTLAIIPGGEAEALRTENGKDAVVLEGRKGFVSLALQHGTPIVPTYTFGNVETFFMSKTFLFRFRNMLQRKFKISVPVFWGVGGTPMPLRTTISFAVGAPMKVPPNPDNTRPDESLVDEYHAKYCDALKALFDQHKVAAGYADRELQVLRAPGSSSSGKHKTK